MSAILEYLFEFFLLMVLGKVLNTAFQHLFRGSSYRVGSTGQGGQPGEGRPVSDSDRTVEGKTSRDPVCGMFVSTELSHRLNWRGNVLHFCSEDCLQSYRKHNIR
jgi:YHS domain-containing protein